MQLARNTHTRAPATTGDAHTVAPAKIDRDQLPLAVRPQSFRQMPPAYYQQIRLYANAIVARPKIIGMLHRYMVRFNEFSDEPQDADLAEDNSQRRSEVVTYYLRKEIEDVYGRFEFDNTSIWCDKEVHQEHAFKYELAPADLSDAENQARNGPIMRTLRVQFNRTYDFNAASGELRDLPIEFITQLAHILHRRYMTRSEYVMFGRAHYIDPSMVSPISIRNYDHLEAMGGFMSTMEHTQDYGTILFIRNRLRLKEKRTVFELMCGEYDAVYQHGDQYKSHEQKQADYEQRVSQECVNRFFITFYARSRIRRVESVDFTRSLDDTFKGKHGEITFRDYYYQAYGQQLRQDFAGLLKVVDRKKREFFFPPELCFLTGYPEKLRFNAKNTGQIAKALSLTLHERIKRIHGVIDKLAHTEELENRRKISHDPNVVGHERLLNYGRELLQVTAQRLTTPSVLYNSQQNGGITMISTDELFRWITNDMRPFANAGGGAFSEASIVDWAICYMDHPAHQQSDEQAACMLRDRWYQFWSEWYSHEAQFDQNLILNEHAQMIRIECDCSPREDLKRYKMQVTQQLSHAIEQCRLQAAVFVLPSICGSDDDRQQVYAAVKALCNVRTGTVTQCIRAQTIMPQSRGGGGRGGGRDKSGASMKGAWRQFCIKLGVIPWKVVIANIDDQQQQRGGQQCAPNPKFNYLPDGAINLNVPTMVIGIDVNHNRRRGKSTIGFIATYDRDFCRVSSQVDQQRMGREVCCIEKMHELAANALEYFYSVNGVYPVQIFVYRDGVSIAELSAVATKELNAIREACATPRVQQRNGGQRIKIEFMVVQKRVNARFFEYMGNNPVGPKPPIVINTGIVSDKLWDFYLMSCEAPRDKLPNPVRVIIVNDDLELYAKQSKNDIELFTYALCNLYYGWAGPVKIPHVIKYADKIAELYSNTVNDCEMRNLDNKPNTKSGIHLAHHYL